MRASGVPDDCVITLSAADVSKTFQPVNIHKAAGPDGLPGHVLGCLVVVGDQAVVLSANLMMVLESCFATQSWVNRGYRRGLSTHPSVSQC